MAAGAILYVGEDICHRIPVMERAGIVVLQSECSIDRVRQVLAKSNNFAAVTFHNDLVAPASEVVTTVRELSRAPLILFRNPLVDCDDWLFDLVISVPTPPEVWASSLGTAIREEHHLRERSQKLPQDCATLRDVARSLRGTSVRNHIGPINYDSFFLDGTDCTWKEPDDDTDGS
jgi:hypothetical protein